VQAKNRRWVVNFSVRLKKKKMGMGGYYNRRRDLMKEVSERGDSTECNTTTKKAKEFGRGVQGRESGMKKEARRGEHKVKKKKKKKKE